MFRIPTNNYLLIFLLASLALVGIQSGVRLRYELHRRSNRGIQVEIFVPVSVEPQGYLGFRSANPLPVPASALPPAAFLPQGMATPPTMNVRAAGPYTGGGTMPTATGQDLSVPDMVRLLNDPVINNDPRRINNILNIRQIEILTRVYNAMRSSGSLIAAICFLEAANWIPAAAMQDFHFSQLNEQATEEERSGPGNSTLDRWPAQAGQLFKEEKKTLKVFVTGKPPKTFHSSYEYDEELYGTFDEYNLSHILRLNRQRRDFIKKEVGLVPTTYRGSKSFHPLEHRDISERYARRDRDAPDFPGFKKLTEEYNKAFENFPVPGWGIEVGARDNVEGDVHRWYLQKYKKLGVPSRRHRAAQKEIRAEHDGQKAEAQANFADSLRFSDQLDAFYEDLKEAEAEEQAGQAGKGKGKGKATDASADASAPAATKPVARGQDIEDTADEVGKMTEKARGKRKATDEGEGKGKGKAKQPKIRGSGDDDEDEDYVEEEGDDEVDDE